MLQFTLHEGVFGPSIVEEVLMRAWMNRVKDSKFLEVMKRVRRNKSATSSITPAYIDFLQDLIAHAKGIDQSNFRAVMENVLKITRKIYQNKLSLASTSMIVQVNAKLLSLYEHLVSIAPPSSRISRARKKISRPKAGRFKRTITEAVDEDLIRPWVKQIRASKFLRVMKKLNAHKFTEDIQEIITPEFTAFINDLVEKARVLSAYLELSDTSELSFGSIMGKIRRLCGAYSGKIVLRDSSYHRTAQVNSYFLALYTRFDKKFRASLLRKSRPKAGKLKRTITEASEPPGLEGFLGTVLYGMCKDILSRGADSYLKKLIPQLNMANSEDDTFLRRQIRQDVYPILMVLSRVVGELGSRARFSSSSERRMRKIIDQLYAILGDQPNDRRTTSADVKLPRTSDLRFFVDVLHENIKKLFTVAPVKKISRPKVGRFKRTITEALVWGAPKGSVIDLLPKTSRELIRFLQKSKYKEQLKIPLSVAHAYVVDKEHFVVAFWGSLLGRKRGRQHYLALGNKMYGWIDLMIHTYKDIPIVSEVYRDAKAQAHNMRRSFMLLPTDLNGVPLRDRERVVDSMTQFTEAFAKLAYLESRLTGKIKKRRRPKTGRFKRTITEAAVSRAMMYRRLDGLRVMLHKGTLPGFRGGPHLQLLDYILDQYVAGVSLKEFEASLSLPEDERSFIRSIDALVDALQDYYVPSRYSSLLHIRRNMLRNIGEDWAFLFLRDISERLWDFAASVIKVLGTKKRRIGPPKSGKFKRTITENAPPLGLPTNALAHLTHLGQGRLIRLLRKSPLASKLHVGLNIVEEWIDHMPDLGLQFHKYLLDRGVTLVKYRAQIRSWRALLQRFIGFPNLKYLYDKAHDSCTRLHSHVSGSRDMRLTTEMQELVIEDIRKFTCFFSQLYEVKRFMKLSHSRTEKIKKPKIGRFRRTITEGRARVAKKFLRRTKIREQLYNPIKHAGRYFRCPSCGAEVTDAPTEKRPCPQCGTLMLYSKRGDPRERA